MSDKYGNLKANFSSISIIRFSFCWLFGKCFWRWQRSALTRLCIFVMRIFDPEDSTAKKIRSQDTIAKHVSRYMLVESCTSASFRRLPSNDSEFLQSNPNFNVASAYHSGVGDGDGGKDILRFQKLAGLTCSVRRNLTENGIERGEKAREIFLLVWYKATLESPCGSSQWEG